MNKGKRLAASHLEWFVFTNLLAKLQKDENYRIAMIIAIQGYTGLRIGDTLKLKWSDFLDKIDLTLHEEK